MGTKSTTADKAGSGDEKLDLFEENYKELRKWVDTASSKFALLTVKREDRAGRHGIAIKVRFCNNFFCNLRECTSTKERGNCSLGRIRTSNT